MPEPAGDLRARLRDALETEPHLTPDDVATTVARLLAEQHGDLRDRIDAALRTVGLARNLRAYRDAVLPVVEAETAAKDREIEQLRELYVSACKRSKEMRDRAEEAERLATRYRMQVDDPDSLLTALDDAERQRDEALAAATDVRTAARRLGLSPASVERLITKAHREEDR